jgi:hypothetical protein
MLYTGSKVGVSMEHPRRSNPYPAAFRPVDGALVFESDAFSYAVTTLYPSAFLSCETEPQSSKAMLSLPGRKETIKARNKKSPII